MVSEGEIVYEAPSGETLAKDGHKLWAKLFCSSNASESDLLKSKSRSFDCSDSGQSTKDDQESVHGRSSISSFADFSVASYDYEIPPDKDNTSQMFQELVGGVLTSIGYREKIVHKSEQYRSSMGVTSKRISHGEKRNQYLRKFRNRHKIKVPNDKQTAELHDNRGPVTQHLKKLKIVAGKKMKRLHGGKSKVTGESNYFKK
mmetsp:Transcript_14215/g.21681  ORF Transcript_14215/g.21681 Transcript_14215/m.21681 type:complete len:202 (-) Transcript_14215:257-862(-)|eukprot:CAMPEP_0178935654 /NCGR_PEP_ID=MMETSP0786-20121207/24675_1 /TAXON_ID=186022 /ORGANISM="Thalassionema frauenfeldii, Strain CCMP 1798" /LENGTH=201 /DNA_ID=CAMNT_0020613845 /DNA_START=271 /DNA_END=876 /DNA_ORIENTATION=+